MIKQKEYARRRTQLMEMTGVESVIILRAATQKFRNNDVGYPYRQDSDFLYLSGFSEPEAMMVLLPAKKGGHSIMFCRERDPTREMWDGVTSGSEGAVEDYGFDEAFPITEMNERLPDLLHGRERIFYDLGKDPEFDQLLIGWMNEFRAKTRKKFLAPDEVIALNHSLHEMRLFKSRPEITAMRKSARIAAQAHKRAMQVCEPGMNEADIHAELLNIFTRNHCEASYIPIVGGGANACVLHYISNRDELHDGDLLLIDAGAEYDGYASDITRTFPVNGKFSGPQKDLYEVVLAAQLEAIDTVREGNPWEQVHEAAVRIATEGMIELGILKGGLEEALEEEHFKNYYVHNTGHWLGLDVHDVGEYEIDGHSRVLEKGMVFTVEPGIYIPPAAKAVDKIWRGMGIRIEDDVVVTREEADILTFDVCKNIDQIEALMAS
ncbi:MAG: aminopeptidase P N-terminal domain-containing protein [Gammaproteobacteria bacterium]|nr:aminopeptidase P N-terminal domain-containing protein [Gammaproteobacteria bacterium]NNK98283.1 M24 family metallopeptidase [Xanthomonadales bacterium]